MWHLQCENFTFLKNSAKEPVFLGLMGVMFLPFGVPGADDALSGLDIGDVIDELGVKALPAWGDVTCTVVEVLGSTTAWAVTPLTT